MCYVYCHLEPCHPLYQSTTLISKYFDIEEILRYRSYTLRYRSCQKKLQYRSLFDTSIKISSILVSKLAALILEFNIEVYVLRYRSFFETSIEACSIDVGDQYRSVCTSISIFVYFDIEEPFIEYHTLHQSTLISKFRHFVFDIEAHLNRISFPISKYCGIKVYKFQYRCCVRDI